MPEPLESEDLPLVPLLLSSLTNLTQLSFFQLCSWDRLPKSLQSLDLDTPYGSLHKLTALTQLQELRIRHFFEAGTADLPDVVQKLSGSLHTLRLELENPYGLTYGGGEFVPWPNPWLESGAQYLAGEEGMCAHACVKQLGLSHNAETQASQKDVCVRVCVCGMGASAGRQLFEPTNSCAQLPGCFVTAGFKLQCSSGPGVPLPGS
jgi:hypothetical protein